MRKRILGGLILLVALLSVTTAVGAESLTFSQPGQVEYPQHHPEVDIAASCDTTLGQYFVVMRVENSESVSGTNRTMVIDQTTHPAHFPVGMVIYPQGSASTPSGSVTKTFYLPGNTSGTILLKIRADFTGGPQNVERQDAVTLQGNCQAPGNDPGCPAGYTNLKFDSPFGSGTLGPITVTVTELNDDDEPTKFNWSISSGYEVYIVHVKAGNGYITYTYPDGSTSGTGLMGPQSKGISHVTFCYKQESTSTPTNTATDTATATASNTATDTPTATASNTATDTPTSTSSPTATDTATNTATDTPTNTATDTATNTPTDTATSTATDTATDTPTNTATDTATNTPTSTASDTATATATDTSSPTPTDTATSTATDTATSTGTNTQTPTSTSTDTSTPTATASDTATSTSTYTPTNTATGTDTNTPTNTVTATESSTSTSTPTNTDTPTATASETSTPLGGGGSETPTNTATDPGSSNTPTGTSAPNTSTPLPGDPPWTGCRNPHFELGAFVNYDEYYSDWMWIDGDGNRHLSVHDIHSVKIVDGQIVVEVPEGMTNDKFVMILYRRSDGAAMLEIPFESCVEQQPTPRPIPDSGSSELPPSESDPANGLITMAVALSILVFGFISHRRRNTNSAS